LVRENARLEFDRKLVTGDENSADTVFHEVTQSYNGNTHVMIDGQKCFLWFEYFNNH